MTLCAEEKRLLNLYRSGSANETADVMRETLIDMPDVRAPAESTIRKITSAVKPATNRSVAESKVLQ